MIERLIDWSARHRVAVVLLTIAAVIAGLYAERQVPVDALPDLGDPQVIVYSQWDRSPDIVEDQVTYPLVSAVLGAPHVKTVRGFSDFGASYVYVVFDEGTDLYWARARTMEYLSAALTKLPAGVKTELGPDASSLGWVYQYALVDSGGHSLQDLRALQDWYIRYHLKTVPGVADVAPVGGLIRQFQVQVDPARLRAYKLSMAQVIEAVRGGNTDTSGRVLEFGGSEYMVRGRGYARSTSDFENIVVAAGDASAVRLRDLGQVTLGAEPRRGVADLDGAGEVVSGIVIMRDGSNARDVIAGVKQALERLQPGLPAGVRIRPIYDRSHLIDRSFRTIRWTLIEIAVTVAVVIVLFLWHVPSALIAVATIPAAVALTFIPLRLLGVSANIMSLGGLAVAVGALVDASIVVVEQVHKRLEAWERDGRPASHELVILAAVKEVAAPSFYALLVIAVSFLPVLALDGQEGRLFRPLAYAKSFAMVCGAVLAITLDPALRLLITRVSAMPIGAGPLRRLTHRLVVGTIHPEERHPVSRALIGWYEPVVRWCLDRPRAVCAAALVAVAATIPAYLHLGSELMPTLDEGTLLYMPSTPPGITVSEASRLLALTDGVLARFPEVEHVLGKAGRADTPTDPAPLSMFETLITLKPESEWRRRDTWYSAWAPAWTHVVLRRITSDRITRSEIVDEMNRALAVAGITNTWTMPVKGRLDMLSTGLRSTVGLKVAGADVETIARIGQQIETELRSVPGVRNVLAERNTGGRFVDVAWDRDALARHGLTVDDAQAVVQYAIGGENVGTVFDGRARYPVNVRFPAADRGDLESIGRIVVHSADGRRQAPVSSLATLSTTLGPSMLRSEGGLLTGYVFIDLAQRDAGSFVAEAAPLLSGRLTLPPGYTVTWSGDYEGMQRMRARLFVVVPLTLTAIVVLLYVNTQSLAKTALILLAVPFSAVGAIWAVALLGYNLSAAVWVGLIALLGVDAETGVFMLLYLDLAHRQAREAGQLRNSADLRAATLQGAVRRIRPKFMTVTTMGLGLLPILWSTGTGSEVMKRIAAPMLGGLITSFILELLIYPVVYEWWRARSLPQHDTSAAV